MINIRKFDEDIYGNLATVYHRTSVENLINTVFTTGFQPGNGAMYGKGFYSTYDIESQEEPKMARYGNLVVKFAVSTKDFFFFDYDVFTKSPLYRILNKPSEVDFVKAQMDYFKLPPVKFAVPFKTVMKNIYETGAGFTSQIAYDFYKQIPNFTHKVEGVIFTGDNDGRVLVSYNSKRIYPMAYRIDGEKDFRKVDRNFEYLRKWNQSKDSPRNSEHWLNDAVISKNAVYTIDKLTGEVVWKNGTWGGGRWENGTWENGDWHEGDWADGTWKKGHWYDGTWKQGNWMNGQWHDGTFFRGEWHDGHWGRGVFSGNWWKGTWNSGTFKDGNWDDGQWKLGRFEKSRWKNGLWENGSFVNSLWDDGFWRAGEFKQSRWYDGVWEFGDFVNSHWTKGTWQSGSFLGGTWEGGTWENGTWRTGIWKDGLWKNGDWENGMWTKGKWSNGIWHMGSWAEGIWEDGIWKKGDWRKGVWQKGKIYSFKYDDLIDSLYDPKKFESLESRTSTKEELMNLAMGKSK